MATPFDGISSKDGAIIIGGGFGGAAAAVALHKVTECRVFFLGQHLLTLSVILLIQRSLNCFNINDKLPSIF